MVVTPSGVRANRLLRERYGLDFCLLADPELLGARAAGALGEQGQPVRCALLYDREGVELSRWRSPTAATLQEGLEQALGVAE